MSIDPEDPRLTAYALGELEDIERDNLEHQLSDSESDEARRIVEEVRETARLLTSTFAEEVAPGLSPKNWKTIEGEIAMPATLPFGQTSPTPWAKWAGYGIAASMLMGVGASAMWVAEHGLNPAKPDVLIAMAPAARETPAPAPAPVLLAPSLERSSPVAEAAVESDSVHYDKKLEMQLAPTGALPKKTADPTTLARIVPLKPPSGNFTFNPPPSDMPAAPMPAPSPLADALRTPALATTSEGFGGQGIRRKHGDTASGKPPIQDLNRVMTLGVNASTTPTDLYGMSSDGLPKMLGDQSPVRPGLSRSAASRGGAQDNRGERYDREAEVARGTNNRMAAPRTSGEAMSDEGRQLTPFRTYGGLGPDTQGQNTKAAATYYKQSVETLAKVKKMSKNAISNSKGLVIAEQKLAEAAKPLTPETSEFGISQKLAARTGREVVSAKDKGFDGDFAKHEVARSQLMAKVDQLAAKDGEKPIALGLKQDINREKTDRVPIVDPIPGEFARKVKDVVALGAQEIPVGGFKPQQLGKEAKKSNEDAVVFEDLAQQLAPVVEVPDTEVYNKVEDNPFKSSVVEPLSTFSIDVDSASYANIRRFLMIENRLPPRDAVRIEEMVNYFPYDYTAPKNDKPENPPFSVNVEVARCPWNAENRLAKIGLKGKIEAERKVSSLTFLVDVSGSMDEPNKLPLVQASLRMLTEQLGENDRVAIVVYAGAAGLVLDSTSGIHKHEIASAIDQLKAGGSTAGGAGINLAYELAKKNFVKNGVNRVILATDGDFNVGVSDDKQLQDIITEKAKTGVFLTVLGFGTGNLKDAKMEQLADKGNGNCYYIDSLIEARKVLVEQMGGTLVTVGKDVKIQVDFNPAKVGSSRLIGYENRVMAAQDFNNDAKDAGEIGAGHTVTALYELTPPEKAIFPKDLESKYIRNELRDDKNGESFTVRLRFKDPDGTTSRLIEHGVTDSGKDFAGASEDFKFASSVAAFGMILRDSPYRGNATLNGLLEWAESGKGKDASGYRKEKDASGYRKEFCDMVRKTREITTPAPAAPGPVK